METVKLTYNAKSQVLLLGRNGFCRRLECCKKNIAIRSKHPTSTVLPSVKYVIVRVKISDKIKYLP